MSKYLFLKQLWGDWEKYLSAPINAINVIVSLLFLKISYEVTIYMGLIATKNAGIEPIQDIVLSHIGRIDTSFIHGTISFLMYDLRWVFFLLFIQCTPFAAKALAMIVFLRAFTINLTHLGMPEGIIPTISEMTFGGDLFFSGHVANTLMLGFCFWGIKPIRIFFVCMSIIFGVAALLGHYHYTIDVVSAPFFAYGVYVLTQKIFKTDYEQSVNFQKKLKEVVLKLKL